MRKVFTVSTYVLLVAALALSFTAFSHIVTYVLLLLSVISFGLGSRGNLHYTKGVKFIEKGGEENFQKGLAYLEKGLREGTSPKFTLMAASVLIQNGRLDAMSYLERLSSSKKKDIAQSAVVALSMGYWQKGDSSKAIEICEGERAKGYADRSLYADLGTYYLKAKRIEDFQSLLKDKGLKNINTTAVKDFQAVSAALDGRWKKAGDILTSVFSSLRPGFAAPYVHMALVHLHYGNCKDAYDMLERAGKVRFSAVGLYDKSMVEDLRELVKADGDSAIATLYVHPRELLCGEMPQLVKGGNLPEIPEEPSFIEENAEEVDEEPNMELNEDDEEWLRRHS